MNRPKMKPNLLLIVVFFICNINSNSSAQTEPFSKKYKYNRLKPKAYIKCDGRFTLGVKGRKIMYGYPYLFSTSHFVIRVDDDFASNAYGFGFSNEFDFTSPVFKKERDELLKKYKELLKLAMEKNIDEKGVALFKKIEQQVRSQGIALASDTNKVTFLRDTLVVLRNKHLTLESYIDFMFKDVQVAQKLTPVDKNMLPVEKKAGQYYRIDYQIVNHSDTIKNIGLLALFDTMIGRNDASEMDVFSYSDKHSIKMVRPLNQDRGIECNYVADSLPKRVLAYEYSNALTDSLTGDFIIDNHYATRPDELHIGPWPLYHRIIWDVYPLRFPEKYDDSAVLMKWNQKQVNPGDTLLITTYYGVYNDLGLDLIAEPVNLDFPEFEAKPSTINRGKSATLRWKTKNPMKGEIQISKLHGNQRNKGKAKVYPYNTTKYVMTIIKDGKRIAMLPTIVEVLPPKEPLIEMPQISLPQIKFKRRIKRNKKLRTRRKTRKQKEDTEQLIVAESKPKPKPKTKPPVKRKTYKTTTNEINRAKDFVRSN